MEDFIVWHAGSGQQAYTCVAYALKQGYAVKAEDEIAAAKAVHGLDPNLYRRYIVMGTRGPLNINLTPILDLQGLPTDEGPHR